MRRLAEREARVLAPAELPAPAAGPEGLVAGLASALHRYLTRHPELLVCRYELALEATRRPELREFFDATGRQFREPLMALMTAMRLDRARTAHAVPGGLVRGADVLVRRGVVQPLRTERGGAAHRLRRTALRDAGTAMGAPLTVALGGRCHSCGPIPLSRCPGVGSAQQS